MGDEEQAGPAAGSTGLHRLAEAELGRRGLRLRFPPALEAQFRRDDAERRVAEQRLITRYGVSLYLVLGLLVNLFLMPGEKLTTALFQFGAVAVIALLSLGFGLRTRHAYAWRESCFFLTCLACTAGPICALLVDTGPLTEQDLVFALLPLNFALVFARPAFPQAVLLCLLTDGAFLLVLALAAPHLPPSVTKILASLLLILSLPSLCGLHWLERAMRKLYLRELIQRLNFEAAAADNAVLADLSLTDALTGIANRRHFDQALQALSTGVPPRGAALLLIDIDFFKRVNDRHGHGVGDTCLRRVAERLAQALPPGTLLARLGGEEFAVLRDGGSLGDALALGEALRRAIESGPIPTEAGPLAVTVSIGLALQPPAPSAEALMDAADAALYRAKSAGRNRVVGPESVPAVH